MTSTVKDEILDNLKCSLCDGYLSFPPIYMKKDGSTICGRCEPPISEHVRNKIYENLASQMFFPCRYTRDGCTKKKLQWGKSKNHEDECEFRNYQCLTGGCEWYGTVDKLLKHYKSVHPNLVTKHPFKIKSDINEDSENGYLISVFGFLFLVQVKVATDITKLYYCVRLIGNPKLCPLFEYQLKICNDQLCLTKKGLVQPEDVNFVKEQSLETDIHGLLNFLGDYNDVTVNITVTMTKTECQDCGTNVNCSPIHHNESGFYCGDCNPEQTRACRYGCPHTDDSINILTHEEWFCRHSGAVCQLCHTAIKGKTKMQHYIAKHSERTCNSDTMRRESLKPEVLYAMEMRNHGVAFLCE